MWQIQNADFSKGGLVTFKGTYRLRHYTTGLFLAAKRTRKMKAEEGTPLEQ
jgi:hypothetical protein